MKTEVFIFSALNHVDFLWKGPNVFGWNQNKIWSGETVNELFCQIGWSYLRVRTPQSEDLCNQATLLVILATLLWSLTEERKGCWFSLEDGLHVLDELHPAGLNADVSVIPHAQQVDRAHDGSNRRVGGPGRGVRHVRPKNQRWFDVEVLETK